MNHILLHKPQGLTPQQVITIYRQLHPKYQGLKLGTVGRLDPLAEGLLVVMVGKENKKQSFYRNLDKTYQVEFILGVSTDSYDLLGLPHKPLARIEAITAADLLPMLANMTGRIHQPYPPYSAVRVQSKPLYWWARQNRLHEIVIPVAERTIYNLSLLSINQINRNDFKAEIPRRVMSVAGDFRQDEIVAAWNKLLHTTQAETVWNIKLKVACSSGTFVRGLVNQIGQGLRCGATTRSIIRTKVGPWKLEHAEQIPIKQLITPK